ncbi:MAG: dihydroorotase [Candidatus Eremiobacteraeota bacterium]|nr:dihydroorotase [Candidatus Eremiobacteraeota bacterium]
MLVRGGRVIDPAQELDRRIDVRLEHDKVVELGEHLTPKEDEVVVDATDAYVAPGFIDMHVHLREPGFPEKETIATGCAAALAGGFTAVACMPNTQPALDTPQAIERVHEMAQALDLARVYPIAAITQGRAGREFVDYASLQAANAVAFSDDGSAVEDSSVLYEAAMRARDAVLPFISHCEDERLRRLGATIAEDVIVARDLLIAESSRKRWHIAHVSTAGSLTALRAARQRGVTATCEATPHHLYFTDEFAASWGGKANVNPPLRPESDVEALRKAVFDGTVDVFASDHAPHEVHEKAREKASAPPGFSGLEVAVGAYALALPNLPLKRYVELLATNPARILKIPGGSLKVGSPADVTVFVDRPWTVDSAHFYSKGRCTPFEGKRLPRRAIATIVGGRLLMRDGAVQT